MAEGNAKAVIPHFVANVLIGPGSFIAPSGGGSVTGIGAFT